MVKVLAWVAAGLVALCVAGALLVGLLFDPNDWRDEIERSFLERTGRELRLDGPLELRFLPRLAVSTGPFSIANERGFGADPLLTVEEARLDLRLWPLLRRHIEIGRVRLDAPRARDRNLSATNGTLREPSWATSETAWSTTPATPTPAGPSITARIFDRIRPASIVSAWMPPSATIACSG